MATTPPTITPFSGAAPQRKDRPTFGDRFDAFITWVTAVVPQLAAFAANVYANAQEAFVSAGTATSAAATAASTANATPWVSGATVQQYQSVISPADGRTYRRIAAAGSGTTDPSSDGANYVDLTSHATLYMKVSERYGSGTQAPLFSGTTIVRSLNTVEWNDVPGASLASNTVTLPAGTYEVSIRAPAYGSSNHQAWLRNLTDLSSPLIGSSSYSSATNASTTDSVVSGRFTISATKQFQVYHYAGGGNRAGQSVGNSINSEVYAEAIFRKVT
jgi:hypothetical protein